MYTALQLRGFFALMLTEELLRTLLQYQNASVYKLMACELFFIATLPLDSVIWCLFSS